jgi:hypothetical protein
MRLADDAGYGLTSCARRMPPLQVELVSCYPGEETLWLVGSLRRLLQCCDKPGSGEWIVASAVTCATAMPTLMPPSLVRCTEGHLKGTNLVAIMTLF